MIKQNNIERLQNFEKIMPLCLALFFCRTIFIGYKYLFFLLLVPCVAYSAYWFLKNGIAKLKWCKLLLPLLFITLFFSRFTPISNVAKESVNLLMILYFLAFANLYYAGEKSETLLKWIVQLTMLVGVIAIVRFGLVRLGFSVQFASMAFEGDGWALVNDNNFYALFFIIALVLAFRLFVKMQINTFEYIAVFVLSLVNIIASVSRRGYVLFGLLIIVILMLSVFIYHGNKKIIIINAVSPVVLFAGCLIFSSFFLNRIKEFDASFMEKTYNLYKLFDSNISFEEYDLRFRMIRAKKNRYKSGDNLFYNGSLKHGIVDWGYISTQHDCVSFELVKDVDKIKAIRIGNRSESGYWQLFYAGRPIFYYKGITYNLSFAYRVIEGGERPFCVGWWVYEGDQYRHNLSPKISPIDSLWCRCDVSYKFQQDHLSPTCFLNSLQAGSTIEVKDISLTCDDTTGLPMYADQLPDSVIHSFFAKEGTDTINYFTSPRTDRWRYALELWQTRYNTKQKIFGQGFKYLEWYGEKFYGNPKRYDFPHNPIISSFLYSGIIGGVVYIIFLIMSMWLYWKRRLQLGIFFIMYLCCMFFCMFSGSSHFSFPLFAFLSFLPFVEAGRKTVPAAEK